jgi:group I intron endonuclease
VNDKCYWGSSGDLGQRFVTHVYYLNKGTSTCKKLQHAWNKYGSGVFLFEAILFCHTDDLVPLEQLFLDTHNAVCDGYNICPTAGSCRGVKRRPESIEKTAAANRGRKASPQELQRIKSMNLGRKHTQDHIDKVVAKTTGQKRSSEFCAELGRRSRGTVTSFETKQRQREAALKRDTSRGGNNVNAKMTPDKVREIRKQHRNGIPFTTIGRAAGLHPSTVADIAYRKTWRHVDDTVSRLG